MSGRLKVGVLVSGRGSNLQVLMDACAAPDYPAEIAIVVSNVADAFALERARKARIATAVVNHKDFAARETFDAGLAAALHAGGAEFICLAGFMRILSDAFVRSWQGKIINIHPSLLPSFKGLHVHEQALAAGVRVSGCTVHYVVPELDAGPIIAQEAVPVMSGDTADTLAARVLEAEHRIYPAALKLVAEKRVQLEGNRAVFR